MTPRVPLISVITPTYNRKELLEKAILSVVNQRKGIPFEWEMIIVDDGSLDGTNVYIKKYLSEYPQIRYVYQENAGVGRARNVGIEHISRDSDYVVFLDSDDELKADLFTSSIVKFSKSWFLWLYYYCEDESGGIIDPKSQFRPIDRLLEYDDFLCWVIDFELLMVLRSALFLDPHFWLRFSEDIITEWVTWSRMWKIGSSANIRGQFLLIGKIGRVYSVNHSGEKKITKTITSDRFRKNALWNDRIIDIIGEDLLDRHLYDQYSELLFRSWVNWILFWERNKWLHHLLGALRCSFSLRNMLVYGLALISKNAVLVLYRWYIGV